MDLLTWIRNQWDRVLAWVLVLAGGLAIVLGWLGVTATPYSFEQIPYVLSGGIGGVFLLGVGAMLWISADLRDEWRVLNAILADEVDSEPLVEPAVDAEPSLLPVSAPSRRRLRAESGR